MRILFLDIETSPNKVYVWGLWQQNVAPNQIIESSKLLCWAAKWQHERTIQFDSCYHSTDEAMVKNAHALVSGADLIVHYHGSAFDMPTLRKEFLLYQLAPPPPARELDLLKVVRRQFRFPSNRLDYVCERLGIGKKFPHEGQELWNKCLHRDPTAWKVMEKYNRQDVTLLERLYEAVLPWIPPSLHGRTTKDPGLQCPACGKATYHSRGEARSKTGWYARYQCQACGSWFRSSTNLRPKGERAISL